MVPDAATAYATQPRRRFSALHPAWTPRLIPLGVGLACLMTIEFMHYLLVPDLGPRKERWLAETLCAIVIGALVAKLFDLVRRHHQATRVRLQTISESNHHIRNALMAITASADLSQNQQCIRVISEGVLRIEWVLREILPRQQPLPEAERTRLMFLMSANGTGENHDDDLNLRIGECK